MNDAPNAFAGQPARDQSAQGLDHILKTIVAYLPGFIYQLADAARQLHPGLKVLYTFGYTENAMVHHGRLDPGVQLLSKPYRRAELARTIHGIPTATSPDRSPSSK